MSRIVLHIGLEKTGSTSFQAYCADNRERLAEAGVRYPAHPAVFFATNHAPLAASYFTAAEARALAIGGRRAGRAEAVAALKAEIAGAALTLISAEHLSSRFDPGRIAALRADLDGFEVEIAAVLRHPLPRAASAYATTVATGRSLTLAAFVDELCQPSNPYLLSRATLEPWANAFGRERIVALAYREGEDIVAKLARRLMPGAPEAALYRRNASARPEAIERRRRANAWPRPLRPLARLLGARATPRLSEGQARRISDFAAADLAWLAREYGVAFD